MGMSTSGLVMTPNSYCTATTVGNLLNGELCFIGNQFPSSLKPKFDFRNKGDVVIEEGEKHFCLMGVDLVDNVVFQGDVQAGIRVLDYMRPSGLVIFWCVYDSGGGYGFAVFKDGKLTRRRCYSVDHGLIESGFPLECEHAWQPAIFTKQEQEDEGDDATEYYRHTSSGVLRHSADVITTIIQEITMETFSWSPLDVLPLSKYSYYRMAQSKSNLKALKTKWLGIFMFVRRC